MENQQSENPRLIQYLLGDVLPDADQEEIEARCFANDSYFAQVLAVEDDLIDAYLQGRLSAAERSRFENSFLASSRRRDKCEAQRAIVDFFRERSRNGGLFSAWRRFFASLGPPHRRVLAASAIASLIGLGTAGLWLLETHSEVLALRASIESLKKQSSLIPRTATFVVDAERLRSGSAEPLRIKGDADWVILRLKLPAFAPGFDSFSASLSTVEGEELWNQRRLSRSDSFVDIGLPASAVRSGDFVLSLSATAGRNTVSLPSYQLRFVH